MYVAFHLPGGWQEEPTRELRKGQTSTAEAESLRDLLKDRESIPITSTSPDEDRSIPPSQHTITAVKLKSTGQIKHVCHIANSLHHIIRSGK